MNVVQILRHYILLCKTTMVADVNSFQYVLTRRIIGGNYNKWIVILQEFDLYFTFVKSKKSLFFAELIFVFPRLEKDVIHVDSFEDEHIFLVSSSYTWYGYIVLYIQTLKFLSISCEMTDDVYDTKLRVTLLSTTLCIVEE